MASEPFLSTMMLFLRNYFLHSIRNESTLTSVYSKKSILDISAILDGGEYVDLEMQVLSERYTRERAAVYSCDLVNRQYSVNQDEKKSTVNFGSVRPVYSITMLKQSPEEFLTNNKYIHKFQQISDSGLRLNLLQKYYFIELDKYQLQHAGTTPDTLLDAWIAFVGTDSIKTRLAIMEKFPEFQEINRELIEMSFDRKELMYMTDHNLELMERNTLYYSGKMEGIQLGKLEGIQLGKQEGKHEGMQAVIEAMEQAGMTLEEIKKIVRFI